MCSIIYDEINSKSFPVKQLKLKWVNYVAE